MGVCREREEQINCELMMNRWEDRKVDDNSRPSTMPSNA